MQHRQKSNNVCFQVAYFYVVIQDNIPHLSKEDHKNCKVFSVFTSLADIEIDKV